MDNTKTTKQIILDTLFLLSLVALTWFSLVSKWGF